MLKMLVVCGLHDLKKRTHLPGSCICSTETTVETITDSPAEMSTALTRPTYRLSASVVKKLRESIWKVEIKMKEVTMPKPEQTKGQG